MLFRSGADFIKHMCGEKLVEETNDRGVKEWVWVEVGPNHLGDCMKMHLVMAHLVNDILVQLKKINETADQPADGKTA